LSLQFLDLLHPDHVGKRLSRPYDVTIHLDSDDVLGQCEILRHELESLIPGPLLVMDTCIHDETAGTQSLGDEHSSAGTSVLVKPHLVAESLRVQGPPFREGDATDRPTKSWKRFVFGGQCDLEVMSGDSSTRSSD